MRFQVEHLLDKPWADLARMGKSRLVQTFSIWFILIPILAKFLGNVDDTVLVTVLGSQWKLNFGLPFNWYLFFLASVFFSIANVAFVAYCPSIIRNYDNFAAFVRLDGSFEKLKTSFREFARIDRLERNEPFERLDAFIERFADRKIANDLTIINEWDRKLESLEPRENILPDAFVFVADLADTLRPTARKACMIFYVIGTALVLIVFIENIWFVLEQFFKKAI